LIDPYAVHYLAVNVASWPYGLGWFYRSLLDNALADPFGGLVTLIVVSVIIKAGRRWWVRLAKRVWRKHGHHIHNARDWWHKPVMEQNERHHEALKQHITNTLGNGVKDVED
jgi:hypothetical protein